MQLNVNISREDIWQFHKYLTLRTTYGKINIVLSFLLYPAIFFLLQAAANEPLDRVITRSIIFTGIWIPSYLWPWKRRVKGMFSDKGNQLGRHVLSISPDRVHAKAELYEEFNAWRGILDIVENSDYIFFFTDIHRAYLIPKKVFDNSDQAQTFLSTALSYWKAANGETG